MYEDLAEVIESYKEKGFTHTFEIENGKIISRDLGQKYAVDKISIIESYRHEQFTDPGTDATVFALETSDGTKGLIVAGYGMYVDPEKAKIIDMLLKANPHSNG